MLPNVFTALQRWERVREINQIYLTLDPGLYPVWELENSSMPRDQQLNTNLGHELRLVIDVLPDCLQDLRG